MTNAKDNPVPTGKVFISYRRDGGAEQARLIYDSLVQRGFRQEDVFLDVEHLGGGHFDAAILKQIDASSDVIALISDQSVQRCRQNEDWVRLELAHAIRQGKNIVPVMPAGFRWPEEPLPEDLAGLSTFNGVNYSHEYFAACMGKLLKLLTARPARRLSRRAMIAGGLAVAGAALAGLAAAWRPRPQAAAPPTTPAVLDPLSLQWYGFGQRLQDAAWREFRVQDGVTMYDGDQFRIVLAPSADCHICVLSFNSDGLVSQLFPNPAVRQRAFCRGGQTIEIPDGVNWFTLDDKTGTETIYLLASYDPLDRLGELVRKVDQGGAAPGSGDRLQQQIAQVSASNQPGQDGSIRTRSGVVVRNVTVAPDRRTAQARLQDGQKIEKTMDVVQGKAALVQRIRFTHVHPKPGDRP